MRGVSPISPGHVVDEVTSCQSRVGIVPSLLAKECFPLWVTMDPFYARGAPVDLILFEGIGEERTMKVPAVGGSLKRRILR